MSNNATMKKILLVVSIALAACSTRPLTNPGQSASVSTPIQGKLFTTLYQQRAAEYRALCLQAFNVAHWQLDIYRTVSNKPRAIITDIDETVLDNSAYEAHQTLQGKDYDPVSWYEWTNMSAADTVPGAPAFLKYAASKGVEIFYITNRDEKERASTMANLRKFNLPNTDDAHLLLKQTISGKEPRRQQVMNTHEVVMLIGDNLADFSSLFDKKNETERMRNTDISTKDFGSRFIVIPNPVYGDWESSLYKFNKYTQTQKDSVIRSVMKTY